MEMPTPIMVTMESRNESMGPDEDQQREQPEDEGQVDQGDGSAG